MNYKDLRKKLKNLEKYPNCEIVPRSPLVHEGFLGTFNISFGEDLMLKEFGGYQFFNHDAVFSTIQKCIRHNDIYKDLKKYPDKYLGIFEMADIFGLICLQEKVNLKELQTKQVKSVINLLIDLGVDKGDIFPKYCGGGTVKELTKGKYTFDKKIPKDKISFDTFIDLGIPEENIKEDYTRDTFLALNFESGRIAWGYRCEIDIRIKPDTFLDVATTEHFMWDPVFNENNKIIGLKDITYTLALTVTGVERLYMAANNINDVREIPHIKKLYEYFGDKSLEIEYLRTTHQIYSDKEKYDFEISKHKKYIINRMIRHVNISEKNMRELLKLNSELQTWSPELKFGIEPTIKVIKKYHQSK